MQVGLLSGHTSRNISRQLCCVCVLTPQMLDARRARITPWSGQGAELLKYRHVNAMQMQRESRFKIALHARQAAVQLDVPMKESDLIQPDEENKMASFLMHWAMGHGPWGFLFG